MHRCTCNSATGNKKEGIMKTRVLGDGGDAAVPHSGQCRHFTGRRQRLTNPDKQWREPCGSCASRQQKLATELTSRGLHRKKISNASFLNRSTDQRVGCNYPKIGNFILW